VPPARIAHGEPLYGHVEEGCTNHAHAFAVLRLTASSNLVGACTGRSAGFSPLRMRST